LRDGGHLVPSRLDRDLVGESAHDLEVPGVSEFTEVTFKAADLGRLSRRARPPEQPRLGEACAQCRIEGPAGDGIEAEHLEEVARDFGDPLPRSDAIDGQARAPGIEGGEAFERGAHAAPVEVVRRCDPSPHGVASLPHRDESLGAREGKGAE
jgi:hypothetical protein